MWLCRSTEPNYAEEVPKTARLPKARKIEPLSSDFGCQCVAREGKRGREKRKLKVSGGANCGT